MKLKTNAVLKRLAEARGIKMEEVQKIRVVQFLHDICIFSGLLLWGALGLVIVGGYQVGWKNPDSIHETVINQVNQEVLEQKIIQEESKKRR